MKRKKIKLYLIATNDRLELPLFYSENVDDIADWLGVKRRAVYQAFIRAHQVNVVKCAGYQVERIWINYGD